MIAEVFVYAIAVTLLIGLAALSVEQFLAEIGRPRRYAWLGAYAAALLFPPLSLLLAARTPIAEAVVATPVTAGPAPSPFDWDPLLLQAWAVATAVLMLAYLAAWIRLAMLAKHWPRVANEKSLVVLSDDVGPAVLGIVSPCIVLPRWLMDSPASVRGTIMAHESEHIAARDQVLIVLSQLVTVLLPWNLPLWWFARRLRASIEVDCDARVLRGGIDAEQYADVLLAVGQRRSLSPYVAAALIEPVTQLERRIRIVLTRRKPGTALRAAAAGALALAIAACVGRVEPPVVIAGADPERAIAIPVQEQVEVFKQLPPAQQQALIRELQRSLPPAQREAIIRMLQEGGDQEPAPDQLEPPSVEPPSAEPPSAEPKEVLPFLFRMPRDLSVDTPRPTPQIMVGDTTTPVRLVKDAATGEITVTAARILIADRSQMQVVTEQVVSTDGTLALEGVKVQLDDRTSITAARAVAKKADDGSLTLTLEDAVVTSDPNGNAEGAR